MDINIPQLLIKMQVLKDEIRSERHEPIINMCENIYILHYQKI